MMSGQWDELQDLASAQRQVKERKTISVSEVRTFLACPLAHYYQYRLGLWIDRTRSFFALGHAVHFGLAAFYRADMFDANRDPVTAAKFYRTEWARQIQLVDWTDPIEKRDPMDMGQEGFALLMAALAKPDGVNTTEGVFVPDEWAVQAVEEELLADIKHSRLGKLPYRLKGRLDMRVNTPSGILIVDHKTAQKRWERGKQHEDAQATAYSEAVRQNFAEPRGVVFNVMVSNKTPVVDRLFTTRTVKDSDRFYLAARAMLDAEEKGSIYPNPQSWNHAGCAYKQLCNAWEGHPQGVPSGRVLQSLVPGLSDRVAGVGNE